MCSDHLETCLYRFPARFWVYECVHGSYYAFLSFLLSHFMYFHLKKHNKNTQKNVCFLGNCNKYKTWTFNITWRVCPDRIETCPYRLIVLSWAYKRVYALCCDVFWVVCLISWLFTYKNVCICVVSIAFSRWKFMKSGKKTENNVN